MVNAMINCAFEELSNSINFNCSQARLKVFDYKIKGNADEESDLDTLIELPQAITLDIIRRILHCVFEINRALEPNLSVLLVYQEE